MSNTNNFTVGNTGRNHLCWFSVLWKWLMPLPETLTDETVHVLRVPGIIWNGEVAVTDGHLTLPKRQSEVAQLVQ